jgi:hypothetical protein
MGDAIGRVISRTSVMRILFSSLPELAGPV